MDIEEAKKERTTAKRRFTRKVNIFKEAHAKGSSVEVLQQMYEEVSNCLGVVDQANETLMAYLKEADQVEHEQYITDLENVKHDIYAMLVNRMKVKQKPALAIKKLEPPRFGGSIRAFPTFVKDYERLVVAHQGKDPYVLRNSLEGEPRRLVEDLDNYDRMWVRLQETYGNPAKMIDSILGDIRATKPVHEGDNKRLINMINIVEKVWMDMENLGVLHELENTTVITKVERLLPTTLKREWAIKVQSIKDDKFRNLVSFLTEHRKAIEYLQDDARAVSAKASVHAVKQEIVEESDLTEVVKQLAKEQERFQSQVLERLAHMSVASNERNKTPVIISPREKFRKCPVHQSDTHELKDCTSFKQWPKEIKFDFLKSKGVCYMCLKEGHFARNCINGYVCRVVVHGEPCGQYHHPCIHSLFVNSSIEAVSSHMATDGVMLMTGYVSTGEQVIPTLYDPGSNITLITHRMARELGLKGTPISLNLTKVGAQTERVESSVYKLRLRDKFDREIVIDACGITEITAESKKVNLAPYAHLFGVQECMLTRPIGKIELLIGADYCVLLPQVVKTIRNVQLMVNDFGLCIRGVLGEGKAGVEYRVQVHHITCLKPDDWLFTARPNPNHIIERYFLTENLGTHCNPRCGGCKCGECSLTGSLSIREERELRLIEDGLKFDEVNKVWISEYPWISDPYKLPNNFSMAVARLKATEKRLQRMGPEYSKKYQEQMEDMVNRGIAQKLTKKELESYENPVFYLPHHEVHKPDSQTTPLRIVFNSAATFQGVALNDLLAKGPDVLNNLLGVLMRFRQNKVGIVGDIKKMYNSVRISEFDTHTHRFLWRDLELGRAPDHYILKTVTFGDKPGGAIAMMALRKTAQMSTKYPLATKMILKDSYVDDVLSSVNNVQEAVERIKQTEEVMKTGGFIMKHWVVSGDDKIQHGKVLDVSNEKVLGLDWKPKEDKFSFKIKLNFSRKGRQGRIETNVLPSELDRRMPSMLTKRSLLSQIASLYDPLGLLTPFTLKAKLLMRDVVMEGNGKQRGGWDEPISEVLYGRAKSLFKEMFLLEDIEFDRCLKPSATVGDPELMIFCDGSNKAYGSVAYIRWKLADGSISSHLVCSKNRIAPARRLSVPRLELCGAVIASRIRSIIQSEMDFEFQRVIHITDSSIVRAQIQKDSFKFNPFVANRIAEIQSRTDPEEWYWVSSEENPADLTTRECDLSELGPGSVWQSGPKFLQLDQNEWPVKQNFEETLPDLVFMKATAHTCEFNEAVPIDIGRFSSYEKLILVTARVLQVVQTRSLKGLCKDPSAQDLEAAENYWIRQVQKSLYPDWEKRFKRLGPRLNENNVLVVGTRISKWMKDNWHCDEFVLLTIDHPFTKLYIRKIHMEAHNGVETCLAKLQQKFWVPGARRFLKSVKRQCIPCRKLDKKVASQRMGELPNERLEPSPPFLNVSLDLFGPFEVLDTVKRRVKRKVYGVIFNCMATRAVYLDVAEGYDTESFLNVFKRFIAVRGFPRKVYSDNGTQLVAANKELQSMVSKWDMKDLTNFGRFQGLSWEFNKAAGAPWENGCSEALIRLVKRSLGRIINDSLSYSELQTVMFDIANLLNERPIGYKNLTDFDGGSVLRPNDLLLGHSMVSVPPAMWDESDNFSKRYAFKNRITNAFWRKWICNYFPSLIIRQKWHVDVRNVRSGDIVLVRDLNVLKGEWKIAQVVDAFKSKDGKVRDVMLRYKICKPGSNYSGQADVTVTRSVHSLVILLPVEEQEVVQ